MESNGQVIKVKVFEQDDLRWYDHKHGTSRSTIGSTGCTISVICSILYHAGYFDIDPGKLNKKLTQNGGYSNGNLVNWFVVAKLYPKVKFIYRHKNYENHLAKEWIEKGMIPIVQVDAAPIGGAPGGKHWVGFVGDRMSIDPWTGKIVNTSTWEPSGMALYEYTPVEKGENMAETPLQACQKDRQKFWDERDSLHRKLGVNTQEQAMIEITRLKAMDSNYAAHKCPKKPITPPAESSEKVRVGSKEFIYNRDGKVVEEISYKPA